MVYIHLSLTGTHAEVNERKKNRKKKHMSIIKQERVLIGPLNIYYVKNINVYKLGWPSIHV